MEKKDRLIRRLVLTIMVKNQEYTANHLAFNMRNIFGFKNSGITSQSVARILKDLRHEGIVKISYKNSTYKFNNGNRPNSYSLV